MEAIFKILETSRKSYSALFDNFPIKQLNTIPSGYRNNIIWNIGHIIATQQSLVYRLSSLPMQIPEEMFERYKIGTIPSDTIDENESTLLREHLFSTIEQTQADYASGKFKFFKEYTTQTGFHLSTLNDALVFNNYHEGLHFGIIMSIRKFI